MLKLDPSRIKTIMPLLATILLVAYFLPKLLVEKVLITQDTVPLILFFLFLIAVLIAYVGGFVTISEKEINADTRVKTNKNEVVASEDAQIINKSKGNENTIKDSKRVSIKND